MRFTSIVEPHEPMRGLAFPPEVVEALVRDSGVKRPRIVVTIGGYSWQTRLAIMRGRHLIGFSNAHREATGAQVGDEVAIEVVVDTSPEEPDVPADLVEALNTSAGASNRFAILTSSQKRQELRLINQVKSSEARARRIAALVHKLGS